MKHWRKSERGKETVACPLNLSYFFLPKAQSAHEANLPFCSYENDGGIPVLHRRG